MGKENIRGGSTEYIFYREIHNQGLDEEFSQTSASVYIRYLLALSHPGACQNDTQHGQTLLQDFHETAHIIVDGNLTMSQHVRFLLLMILKYLHECVCELQYLSLDVHGS